MGFLLATALFPGHPGYPVTNCHISQTQLFFSPVPF
jgi:hypothetical protein